MELPEQSPVAQLTFAASLNFAFAVSVLWNSVAETFIFPHPFKLMSRQAN
jgi:hypothetical protein